MRVRKKHALFVKTIWFGGIRLSWKTMSTSNKKYKTTMTGTEKEWEKKLKDITDRKHEIIRQGSNPYRTMSFEKGEVRSYWAEVKMPD
jgi:hypothetical protein